MSLINTQIPQTTSTTYAPTNHIFVVDCSGSMYNELPKIRAHLKAKIPTLVKPDDTLTIIWFSGTNQYGVLFEGVAVNGLTDLSAINTTIDRYLTDVGLTGFKQPLEEVLAVTKRLPATQHSMMFLSDGYDNTSSKKDIIAICNALSPSLVSAAFIEYGFYADHDMLSEMAETVGGSLVQASDFTKLSFQLDSLQTLSFGKRLAIKFAAELELGKDFVIGHTPTGFVIVKPERGEILLPSNTTSYSYFDRTISENQIPDREACAVVAALIQRGMADEAIDLAGAIGDVALFSDLENAFSKQDLMRVVDHAEKLATGVKPLFSTAPKNTGIAPSPTAYNVLELLLDLVKFAGTKLVVSHPAFKYTIGGKPRKPREIDGFAPTFTDSSPDVVAEIANLTFDSERPNVSILIKRNGSVSLPINPYGLGESFDTYIWRNYTIVRDGIVNVPALPVILTQESYDHLVSRGMKLPRFEQGEVVVLDLSTMPIINRSMVTSNSLTSLYQMEFHSILLASQAKYAKTLFEKAEVGDRFATSYGDEGAKFLKQYGITEGGFSPLTDAVDVEMDRQVAKVMTVKLSGLSSIPKVADVLEAIKQNKKLTPSQAALAKGIALVDAAIATGQSAESVYSGIQAEIKAHRAKMVRIKFGTIIGRKWFTESTGYDDTVRSIDFGLGKPTSCDVQLVDKLV